VSYCSYIMQRVWNVVRGKGGMSWATVETACAKDRRKTLKQIPNPNWDDIKQKKKAAWPAHLFENIHSSLHQISIFNLNLLQFNVDDPPIGHQV